MAKNKKNNANTESKKKVANGEGSLIKKENGYELQITVGINPLTGRPKRKSFSGKTIKEVRAKEREYYASIENGTFLEPNRITVGEWVDKWLKVYKFGTVDPRTFDYYDDLIRLHIKPKLGNIILQKLNKIQIQEFYNELYNNGNGLSVSRIKGIRTTLYQSLDEAVDANIINKNPANRCVIPKERKSKKYEAFTEEEISKILKVIDYTNTYEIAIMLAFATGLRQSELLALTWEDIDLENKCLDVNKALSKILVRDDEGNLLEDENSNKYELIVKSTKTESSNRMIPLQPNIIPILRKQKLRTAEINLKNSIPVSEENLVFPSQVGTKINAGNLTRQWRKLLDRAKVSYLKFHCIRHTFITQLVDKGGNIKTIQNLAGHSTITTTLDVYAHSSDDSKLDTISKLNDLFPNVEDCKDVNKIEESPSAYNKPAS
jgi:integrase